MKYLTNTEEKYEISRQNWFCFLCTHMLICMNECKYDCECVCMQVNNEGVFKNFLIIILININEDPNTEKHTNTLTSTYIHIVGAM